MLYSGFGSWGSVVKYVVLETIGDSGGSHIRLLVACGVWRLGFQEFWDKSLLFPKLGAIQASVTVKRIKVFH